MATTTKTTKAVKVGAKKQSAGKNKGKKTARQRQVGPLRGKVDGATLVFDLTGVKIEARAKAIVAINDFIKKNGKGLGLVAVAQQPKPKG